MALKSPPRDLPPCPDPAAPAASLVPALRAAGFLEPDAAAADWAAVGEVLPPGCALRERLGETWENLSRAADPGLALRHLGRWLESLVGSGAEAFDAAMARWDSSPLFRDAFVLLLGSSPAVGDDLVREWEAFHPEGWRSGWETPASMERRLAGLLEREAGAAAGPPALAVLTDETLLTALKRFRRVEELRIIFLDEYVELPVDEVTRQISWLADVLVGACLDRALADVARRFRVEPPAKGLVVLGLGKLGGLELNYSSDIDLVFVIDDTDEAFVEGARAAKRQGRRAPPAGVHDPGFFFTRVAERLIELLTAYTGGPSLYRVDTRLRPEGSAGRLVWSLGACLEYYHSVGRTWERQALIRLRPIAGDLPLGRRLQARLDPFVFRGMLTERELEDLKHLKAQIESLASARERSGTHVKIGQGGIRDVEFIVQYLQLLHGAEHAELKRPNVFEVLESLQRHGFLHPEDADSLGIGYRLLRRVENRIQMTHRLQTHTLPADPAELARIARGLGFETPEAFRGRFHKARARIRAVFRRRFEGAVAEGTTEETIAALLELPIDAVKEKGIRFLEPFGFREPDAALGLLRRIAGEGTPLWDKVRAEESFRAVAAALLREVSQFPEPDRALSNFADAVSTLGARSVFFDLLRESPDALRKMVEVCGRSTYLVGILRSYPGLFDEAIDCLRIGYRVNRDELVTEVERVISDAAGDLEALTGSFFELKYLHVLVTAFRDMERRDNLMTTMLGIAQIAEAILHGALVISEAAARHRLGEPVADAAGPTPARVVLGLGKLGGEEMNYRSDLDLVVLYRGGADPATAATGGGATTKGFSIQEYSIQVAQGLFSILARRGPLGILWDSDARLRPMGSKNVLAVSLEAWRSYFVEGPARTWERQAVLRARPVAGDPGLGSEVHAFIVEHIPLRPEEDRPQILREVADMRRRLEESVPRGDIKRGRGGIMDVEFLVQALQLLHGRERPEVIAPNTVTGILRLMEHGVLDSHEGSELLSAYEFLRWLETRFSLLLAPEESISKLDRDRLRSLIQRIGYRSSGEEDPEEIFLDELEYHRERNRSHFERIVGPAG